MSSINSVYSIDHRKIAPLRWPGTTFFTKADLWQMEALGITAAQALDQIERYRKPGFHVRLVRPCTRENCVMQLNEQVAAAYVDLQEKAAGQGRLSQFVPASGAASRMFQSLLQIHNMPHDLDPDELHFGAKKGVAAAGDFIRFLDQLKRFPFARELEDTLAEAALDLHSLLNDGQYRIILDYLLSDVGLDCGSLPKGLLKFHRYPDECRTAFEEHLVEAVGYLSGRTGRCSLHFTVSPQHEDRFADLLEKILPSYERRYSVSFDVSFSHQKASTNTIAVDLENRPFRDRSGSLHFRPGGHGALLGNLNDLEGDLVYIRNIDNLVPDRLKHKVARWKRSLGGVLVAVQEAVFSYIRALNTVSSSHALIESASRFARELLFLHLPESFDFWHPEGKRRWLLDRLNRPIRVCGVVPNQGQPGGAPFWVEKDGDVSIQIVEQAQVDFDSPEQRSIWMSSTHFNPVDIVCGVRDYEGKPFDLECYVDEDAVFISRKSKDGKPLKALELPGLWNGSMADWITVLVEVPAETFNPVKTIFDLLKPEHQP